jgi:hypothetical protein
MKQIVTFRIESTLLESARQAAEAENRTLTNFVETVLKQRLYPTGRDHSTALPTSGDDQPARSEGGPL